MENNSISFITMLRHRLSDAQLRLVERQAKLQIAQAEHQMAMQEVGSLQTLINLETNREQQKATEQNRTTSAHKITPPQVRVLPSVPLPAAPGGTATQPVSVSGNLQEEFSKTDIVREVLRKHTNGITPADVWRLAQDKVERPYVYSILKRMKDRGDVEERAGKYYLQVSKKEQPTGI